MLVNFIKFVHLFFFQFHKWPPAMLAHRRINHFKSKYHLAFLCRTCRAAGLCRTTTSTTILRLKCPGLQEIQSNSSNELFLKQNNMHWARVHLVIYTIFIHPRGWVLEVVLGRRNVYTIYYRIALLKFNFFSTYF